MEFHHDQAERFQSKVNKYFLTENVVAFKQNYVLPEKPSNYSLTKT